MKIYLAGPLFSLGEREFNKKLSGLLIAYLTDAEVILPQELPRKKRGHDPFHGLFEECIGSIEGADIVLAVLDGPDVDAGTSFEIGYAFAKHIPVIGIRTDPRQLEESGVNLMISRSVTNIISAMDPEMTLEVLARTISETIDDLGVSLR